MDYIRKGNAVKGFRKLMREKYIAKYGNMIMPHLVPGSCRDTILENNQLVADIKCNPTYRKWRLFLDSICWRDDGERLINLSGYSNWPMAYALAKTFTGLNVEYELGVTAEMFDYVSHMCFPEAMNHIINNGHLDCYVSWDAPDFLRLWATLDYGMHYPDKDCSGMKLFYWDGRLDRNGILIGKLELRKSDKLTY